MEKWKNYRYKNLTYFVFSLLVAFFLSQFEVFHTFLLQFGGYGYIGAFIAGILFVSTFTVATSAVILLILAERLSPMEIGFIAGLGAVVGDLIIFRFIKDNLVEEVAPLYNKFGGRHVTAVFRSKYFSWSLPVIGAIIIASPFPDEVGITLLGISKINTFKFLLISFLLNAIGIFFIVTLSLIVKP